MTALPPPAPTPAPSNAPLTPPPPPKANGRTPRRTRRLAAVAVTLAAVLAAVALVGWRLDTIRDDHQRSRPTNTTPRPPATIVVPAEHEPLRIDDIVAWTVGISDGERTQLGIITSDTGDIVTTSDIVGDLDEVTVVSANRSWRGRVIGRDITTGLALIDIDGKHTAATWAGQHNSGPQLGDDVYAIGIGPTGIGVTVTGGTLASQQHQRGRSSGWVEADITTVDRHQGGPLVDRDGHLIGIVGAHDDSGELEVVATATTISEAADRIHSRPNVADSYTGVWLSLDDNGQGAPLEAVLDDGPAGQAGLLAGDIVVSIAGVDITGPAAYGAELALHQPGDTLAVDYIRDGERHSTKVTVIERPPEHLIPDPPAATDDTSGDADSSDDTGDSSSDD